MLYAPPIDRPPALHNVASLMAATRDERTTMEDRFDVTRRHIPSPLILGDTVYSLRSQLLGTFYPGHSSVDGEFVVPQLFPEFVGRGRHSEEAFLDWRNLIHCQFQVLYAKRPFEMTDQEKATWQLIESQIDVTAYRTNSPLMVRQIGKVGARVRPHPEVIEWENGSKENVRLEQMPGEFATYRPGQPFEAIVSRDAVDFHLLKVTHIQRIRPLPWISGDDFKTLIESIPTTKSLPAAVWE
jgi:hypothetical protein